MPRRTFAPVLGALLALVAAQAMASGFGRMNNATVLGQRLDFSVPLQLDAGQKGIDEGQAKLAEGEGQLAAGEAVLAQPAVRPSTDAAEAAEPARMN